MLTNCSYCIIFGIREISGGHFKAQRSALDPNPPECLYNASHEIYSRFSMVSTKIWFLLHINHQGKYFN